jgi:hypothetical protein
MNGAVVVVAVAVVVVQVVPDGKGLAGVFRFADIQSFSSSSFFNKQLSRSINYVTQFRINFDPLLP